MAVMAQFEVFYVPIRFKTLDRIIVIPRATAEQKATPMYGSHSVSAKRYVLPSRGRQRQNNAPVISRTTTPADKIAVSFIDPSPANHEILLVPPHKNLIFSSRCGFLIPLPIYTEI